MGLTKPRTSYELYLHDKMKEIKVLRPNYQVKSCRKISSANFKLLTPAQSDVWVLKAKADQERYNLELLDKHNNDDNVGDEHNPTISKSHSSSSSSSSPNNNSSNNKKKSSKKSSSSSTPKKVKAEKDPNKPKMARPSYTFFTMQERANVKLANPHAGFGEHSKILGEMWSKYDSLTKQPFEEMARNDKKRHEIEMSTYVPPPSVAQTQQQPQEYYEYKKRL
ncbi:hypothetical protein ScalyP_jg4030 [Parmales sp. scaly parma]|nr:hypothetical protein ScalyP_jg4030 [Parmales sp. scaly parma]|tara:strand:- start:480 stop:1145 length:666 start_codon:yes stop_codon:yes gene_type:complete